VDSTVAVHPPMIGPRREAAHRMCEQQRTFLLDSQLREEVAGPTNTVMTSAATVGTPVARLVVRTRASQHLVVVVQPRPVAVQLETGLRPAVFRAALGLVRQDARAVVLAVEVVITVAGVLVEEAVVVGRASAWPRAPPRTPTISTQGMDLLSLITW